jgi:dienelactone hydrolase
MTYFTDKAGRPGPATWEGGVYPDGQDDYPVSGISWYEASAYAEFVGKSLPTDNHWNSGAGIPISGIANYFNSRLGPVSNFNGKGPEPVGKSGTINTFGACDMAGNVREWCLNETKNGRVIRGDGYDDVSYMYGFISQLPAFDRSPKNGFRCVQYIDKEKISSQFFQPVEFIEGIDFSKEKPVPENIFLIYKSQFLYDKTDLNAKVEKRDESPNDWIREKITFNAAYGNERVIAYLFLPKNTKPPFQTLVFFPGTFFRSENDLVNSKNVMWFIDYILKNGRAVMCPIYIGTFERLADIRSQPSFSSHQFVDWLYMITKDLSRSIDYLETRSDIDIKKLGYYGHSFGGRVGLIINAVEDRLKVFISVVGGFSGHPYPEANPINYVTRIKIPVLMLNGKYDVTFPYETAVKPLFDLLGTPAKDKRICVYETDHYVPKNEMIKETLNWLDRYFGPVKK